MPTENHEPIMNSRMINQSRCFSSITVSSSLITCMKINPETITAPIIHSANRICSILGGFIGLEVAAYTDLYNLKFSSLCSPQI